MLAAKSVRKKIKNIEILRDINFSLNEAETLGIVGDNGVGKTLLLFILLGLISPDSGEVICLGGCPGDERIRERINVIFGNSRLFSELSPYQNIRAFSSMYGVKLSDSYIISKMKKYNLTKYTNDKKTKMSQLSSGENAKMHLIKAFINSPKILFMDEPTAHLDGKTRSNFYNFFQNEKRKRVFSSILISHSVPEVKKLCDRVLTLREGKLKKM